MHEHTYESTPAPEPTPHSKRFLLRFGFAAGAVGYIGWMAARAAHVALRIMQSENPSAAGTSFSRFQNYADGPTYDGFGLNYTGWTGAAWASAQAIVLVLSLLVCSFAPMKARRLAALALLLVSSLWFANTLYFAIIADALLFGPLAALHLAGFAFVIVFVYRRIRRRPSP